MVMKKDIYGNPYLVPPYTDEEMEYMWAVELPPIAFASAPRRRPTGPALEQSPQPAADRPDEEP